MISDKMQAALNDQINEELYSSYLYASMVGYFESVNLKGFANWMRMQLEEERIHARKIEGYLYERGAKLKLKAIAEPTPEWESPLAAFEAAYTHECHISACINKLSDLAIDEGDHATKIFLEWFVTEQVEEESNTDEMVQQLKMISGSPGMIFMLDREAGQRPAPVAAEPAP